MYTGLNLSCPKTGLRGQLQQLVIVARKYCGTGLALCDHGRELAGVLMNQRG